MKHRAVSPVVAVILLVAVAVTITVAVAYWMTPNETKIYKICRVGEIVFIGGFVYKGILHDSFVIGEFYFPTDSKFVGLRAELFEVVSFNSTSITLRRLS